MANLVKYMLSEAKTKATKRGREGPFCPTRSRESVARTAEDSEQRQQALEDVVETQVDTERRADVVVFVAITHPLQVMQDERGKYADRQHDQGQHQRAGLDEEIGD